MFSKKQPINTLKDGQSVDDVFVVKIKKAMTQYAKGYSFNLLLSDSSGRTIDYKYWGGQDESKVKQLYDSIKADSVLHVQGKCTTYNEKLQIATNEPFTIEVLEEGQYNKEDFIKKSRKNIEEMYEKLMQTVNEVENEELKKLLKTVFENENIAAKFKKHPAAIEIHHNWIGGLLEHTLEVTDYCKLSARLFPSMDKDLLITGALLHDIGKLEEIETTARIKGTDRGQLTGHITIGASFITKKMKELEIGKNLQNKLIHILISHHGKKEFGSPKEPMFPEALVVYYADDMSSKIAEITEFVKDSREATEDNYMFHPKKNLNILLR